MTFIQACEIIRDIKHNYKVIHRYRFDIPWSFKFELKSKQYDPYDILCLHLINKTLPPQAHKQIGLSVSDLLPLIQLSNGAWKFMIDFDPRYVGYKETFEQTTGIHIT